MYKRAKVDHAARGTFRIWRKGNLEENISELIELTHGESVRSSKRDINNWLKAKNLDLKTLILKSSRENIEEAFPSWAGLLRELMRDP